MTTRIDKIMCRFKKSHQELHDLANHASEEIAMHDQEIEHHEKRRKELTEEKFTSIGIANKIGELLMA